MQDTWNNNCKAEVALLQFDLQIILLRTRTRGYNWTRATLTVGEVRVVR